MSEFAHIASWFDRYEQQEAEALYVHIPFCKQKCIYCDFATWAEKPDSPLFSDYTDALIRRLDALKDARLLSNKLQTAYIGGGTPTFLGANNLSRLVAYIHENFSPEELSFEANPESTTLDLLERTHEAGATRVSYGVQTTDVEQLKLLGRTHTNEQAKLAISQASALGFAVSADIMCATENLSLASLGKSISDVLGWGATHVSVYPLQIEPTTALYKKTLRTYHTDEPAYNDPDIQAAHMLLAEKILSSAGLSRYEVASYAALGKACKHNQIYWQGKNYLGIGTGAASMLSRSAYMRLRELLPKLPLVSPDCARVRLKQITNRRDVAKTELFDDVWETEELNCSQALAEDLMLDARQSAAIDPLLDVASTTYFGEAYLIRKRELIAQGFLDVDLKPTKEGWLLGDVISRSFIELEDVGTYTSE